MSFTHRTESVITFSNSSTPPTYSTRTYEPQAGRSQAALPALFSGVIICSVLVMIVIVLVIRRKRRAKNKFNNTAATYTVGVCNGVPRKDNDIIPHSEIDETTNNTSATVVVIKKDKLLDWNKILRFLARNIHAESWLMFFDCLYGTTNLPKNVNCRERIRRVEMDVRSRSQGTEYLILEQFKAWKDAAGNKASIEMIKTTLTDLGHMDTLETFNTFMRDPPFLNGIDEPYVETQSSNVSQSNVFAMPSNLPSGSKVTTKTYRSITFEMLPKERNEPEGANKSNSDVTINTEPGHSQLRLSLTGPNKCDDQFKPNFRETKSRCHSKTKKLKRLAAEKRKQEPLRVQKGVSKTKKKVSECLTRKSFELLMASYFETNQEIKPDMHNIYTKNIINELVKYGIQKGAARRLTYKEYSEIESICTKRGDIFHCLYIEERPYFLNSNTHNKLKLYADHARSKVLHRLQNTNEEDTSYMFIDFNGIPIFQTPKVNSFGLSP